MWLTWNDLDRRLAAFDQFRRQVDNTFRQTASPSRTGPGWPSAVLFDTGSEFVFRADVPGVSEEDLTIDLHNSTLTVAIKREPRVPDGYARHRHERAPLSFKQSFQLSAKVDPEKTRATLTDGVLNVTLEKLPEAQARRIALS